MNVIFALSKKINPVCAWQLVMTSCAIVMMQDLQQVTYLKKIILNSVIHDANKGARFMSTDIKDHFLATPMKDPECMRVKHKHLPDNIRTTCNLEQMKTPDDHVCVKIQKGSPGLKQSAMLACQHLKNYLEPCGCKPTLGIVGLWGHFVRPKNLPLR